MVWVAGQCPLLHRLSSPGARHDLRAVHRPRPGPEAPPSAGTDPPRARGEPGGRAPGRGNAAPPGERRARHAVADLAADTDHDRCVARAVLLAHSILAAPWAGALSRASASA